MNVEQYLENIIPKREYIVAYFATVNGGLTFNSVNNAGQLVQYYSENEISQFSALPICLTTEEVADMKQMPGISNKFVATVYVMQQAGLL